MVFAEMIRNTIEHGSGSNITVGTDHNTAEMFISDENFDFEQLLSQSQPGGGADSLRLFWRDHGELLEVSAEASEEGIYIRVNARALASPMDPCSLQLERSWLTPPQLDKLQGCSTIHVYAPEHFMLSDKWVVEHAVKRALELGARVAVHHRREQSFVQGGVRQQFQDELSRIDFCEFD